jgi:hypothetical protein
MQHHNKLLTNQCDCQVYTIVVTFVGRYTGPVLLDQLHAYCLHDSSDAQVATELVIGFPTSFLTEELLARQKCLFLAWLAGFVALPINLPGFGKQIKSLYK